MIMTAQNNAGSAYYCLVLSLCLPICYIQKYGLTLCSQNSSSQCPLQKKQDFKCLPITLHAADQ